MAAEIEVLKKVLRYDARTTLPDWLFRARESPRHGRCYLKTGPPLEAGQTYDLAFSARSNRNAAGTRRTTCRVLPSDCERY